MGWKDLVNVVSASEDKIDIFTRKCKYFYAVVEFCKILQINLVGANDMQFAKFTFSLPEFCITYKILRKFINLVLIYTYLL